MNNIRVERARKRMSQAELADELGISTQRVLRWESDKVPIPSDMAIKMAHLFGCSVDYLFGETDNPRPAFYQN